MDESIYSLREAIIFFTIDDNSAYWCVAIDGRDCEETALNSHHRLYQFARVPFGLKLTPALFQAAIDIIPSAVKTKTTLVYFVEIVNFSKTVKNHIAHTVQVPSLLDRAGITLNLKKRPFFADITWAV